MKCRPLIRPPRRGSDGTLHGDSRRYWPIGSMRPRPNGIVTIFARQCSLAAAGCVIEIERIKFVSLRWRNREIAVRPAVRGGQRLVQHRLGAPVDPEIAPRLQRG